MLVGVDGGVGVSVRVEVGVCVFGISVWVGVGDCVGVIEGVGVQVRVG